MHNLTSSKTKLGNRDREAFHDVVWKYHSVLLRRARFAVSDYALGGEAVQEAMFAKLRGIRNFEGRSSLKTWRLSILDNRARSLIEKLLLPILVGSSSAKKRMTLHPIHIVACSPAGIPGTRERVVME